MAKPDPIPGKQSPEDLRKELSEAFGRLLSQYSQFLSPSTIEIAKRYLGKSESDSD